MKRLVAELSLEKQVLREVHRETSKPRAAANSCVMLMFTWAAERFKLNLLSYECCTEGTKLIELDRTELFTRLHFHPVVRVQCGSGEKSAAESRIRRALQAAQKYSLVANSVKSEIVIDPDIAVIETVDAAIAGNK